MGGIDHKAVQARALAARLFTAGLGAAELLADYLGMRLGLYEALAAGGPATAQQLAERAAIAPRYAREWLEQQTVSDIIEVDDVRKPPDERLYILPEGHAEALMDQDSLYYVAPMALLPVGGIAQVLPLLLDAYRRGTGVAYAEYGADFRGGQSGLNRAVFLHYLVGWIRTAMPELHARMADEGGRVADIACGVGWSSIALALAYPKVQVDGLDLDEASVRAARSNAVKAGVSGRVNFEVRDASESGLMGRYELVCIFDALHDMARPVEVLRSCQTLLAEGGSVLLMEPNASEEFVLPASEIERYLYAISLLHCLPVGLSEQPSVGTGTMIVPSTIRAYATQAGFIDIRVLPTEHRFYRLYHLKC
jgi:2-polyprenyl-3-methyl-5-hydroxy-6-metoxy-1,4-benzoquinol methylase